MTGLIGLDLTNLPLTLSFWQAILLLPENFLLIGRLRRLPNILDLYFMILMLLSANESPPILIALRSALFITYSFSFYEIVDWE